MSGYGKIYESSYWGVGVCENTIGWGSSYKSIANCTDASFSYPQDSYPTNGVNPTPTITGDAGGTFTATPSGLTLNASTGEITLSTSTVNSYTIRYTLPDSTFAEQSMQITAPAFASTQSFSFDGVDGKFTIEPITFSTASTLSAWAKRNTTGNMFLFGNTNSGGYGCYFVGTSGVYVQGSGGYFAFTNSAVTTAMSRTDWVNWVFIKDSSTNLLSVYVDGVLAQSTTSVAGMDSLTSIGGSGLPTGNQFIWNGNIDEVALWSSVLSSDALTEIYNSGVPNDLDSLSNASSPTVWYRMGE